MITKFAGKWLTENIQEQLRVDPDPTKITIGMKKSDLVEPFCGWIAAATTEIKTRTAMIRRGWEKTGVMIAWSFGSEDRAAAVAEGQELHAKVELWRPVVDKVFQNGTIPRTRLVCHGAVQDLGVQAARAVGGFGENDQAEDADAAEPVDFALLGDNAAGGEEGEEQEEPEEKKKEEEKKEEKEEKKNGRKKKTKELVKEAEQLNGDDLEQLPEALCAQFEAKVTRRGRFSVVPKKFRHDADSD